MAKPNNEREVGSSVSTWFKLKSLATMAVSVPVKVPLRKASSHHSEIAVDGHKSLWLWDHRGILHPGSLGRSALRVAPLSRCVGNIPSLHLSFEKTQRAVYLNKHTTSQSHQGIKIIAAIVTLALAVSTGTS